MADQAPIDPSGPIAAPFQKSEHLFLMGRLAGQVALVTGAGAGIGRAVALRFADEGAHVVALDRSAERLAALSDLLGERGRTIVGDAASAESNAQAVALAISTYGRLDTLVGNVGIFDWHKRVARMSAAQIDAAFDELFAINVKAHILAFHAALPHLREARGSAILTCSNASFRAGGGGALYTASKFAVRGLILQLASESAPDIRVNGVAPGGTITSLAGAASLNGGDRALDESPHIIEAIAAATPLGFAAAPEDHTGLYVTLAASCESRAVTGAIFVSDGGLTLSV
jgi:NAD(P)-dependent dehydrogenase (short-subunit alcohol dehydrogenase family)